MTRTRPWMAAAALCATMPLLTACTPANLMPGANQATPEQTAEQVLQALQTGNYPAVGAPVTSTEYVHRVRHPYERYMGFGQTGGWAVDDPG